MALLIAAGSPSTVPPLPAALVRRRARPQARSTVLHRPRREQASARLCLFRERAGTPIGGEAAHPRRGAAHGGELRQAAGAAAVLAGRCPYSITLSARTNNADGTVIPSALAVLRLITKSNLSGCSIGKSCREAPRIIFPGPLFNLRSLTRPKTQEKLR